MTTQLLDGPASVSDAEWAEIVDALNRRELIAGGLGSVALLGLAACGSSSDDTETNGAWSFTDDLGKKLRLARRPRRIVALADVVALSLYSAGLSVVGAQMVEGTAGLLRKLGMPESRVKAIIGIGTDQINLESVAKAKPDLLVDVVQNGKSEQLSQFPGLAKLAPVVAINFQTAPLDRVMSSVDRLVASLGIHLTDIPAQARYDQVGAQLRTALAAKPGLRVAFCWSDKDGISVNTERQWGSMKTLAGLGMQFTPAKAAPTDWWQTFSWEDAPGLDADLVVLWSGGVPTSPAWRIMPAVKAGQYVDMSNQWFLNSYSSYATNFTTLLRAVRSAHVVA